MLVLACAWAWLSASALCAFGGVLSRMNDPKIGPSYYEAEDYVTLHIGPSGSFHFFPAVRSPRILSGVRIYMDMHTAKLLAKAAWKYGRWQLLANRSDADE